MASQLFRDLVRAAPPALVLCLLSTTAHAEPWLEVGPVFDGTQFDVVAGQDRLHVATTRYLELSPGGDVLASEDLGDVEQAHLMHSPAIARDAEGLIHVALRSGGDFDGGYSLGYRRRETDGTWSAPTGFGTPARWNWQVGVAADGNGGAYLLATETGPNVWADLHVFHATGGAVLPLTQITGWYRVDNIATLRGDGARVALASGDNSQPMRLGWGLADAGLATALSGGTSHAMGAGDHGFPSLDFDGNGALHVSYGSGFTDHNQFPAACSNCMAGQVHYARLDAAGTLVPGSGRTVLSELDTWHLSIGMSAIAATDDGLNVVVAGLKTHDAKVGEASSLLSTFSTDGGATWSPALDTGRLVHAGEGRLRPRMVGMGERVYLFVSDNAAPGRISLSVMEFPTSGGDDGGGTETTGGDESTSGDDGLGTTGSDGETGLPATTNADSATSTAGGSGLGRPPAAPSTSTGCDCRSTPTPAPTACLSLLLLALGVRRRRPTR